MSDRFWIVCGALLSGLAVAAAAYGAHGLKPQVEKKVIESQRLDDFEIAVRNHSTHAIALVLVGLVARGRQPSRMIHIAGAAFLAGLVLFCGGLYAYAVTDNRAFVAAAPIGGISLMVGWLALAIAAWRTRPL
ncbi:MAG TPA: DUF423 domain-containing protein [Pirellulales bacterium]|nr:DUF423 domain-containing protein [Pirellulales bacterium]